MKEKTLLHTLFEHEITKIVGIVVASFGVFKMVVLPIQEIQLGLSQVQKDILEIKGYRELISKNADDIIRIQEQLRPLLK